MVIDSSVLVALLLKEPEADAFLAAMENASTRLVSTATVLETSMVILGRLRGEGGPRLQTMLKALDLEVVPFTTDQLDIAMEAFRRFGKGHHPAALNFGDCFSYALASATGEPLLFKGEDFARTDIPAAA